MNTRAAKMKTLFVLAASAGILPGLFSSLIFESGFGIPAGGDV